MKIVGRRLKLLDWVHVVTLLAAVGSVTSFLVRGAFTRAGKLLLLSIFLALVVLLGSRAYTRRARLIRRLRSWRDDVRRDPHPGLIDVADQHPVPYSPAEALDFRPPSEGAITLTALLALVLGICVLLFAAFASWPTKAADIPSASAQGGPPTGVTTNSAATPTSSTTPASTARPTSTSTSSTSTSSTSTSSTSTSTPPTSPAAAVATPAPTLPPPAATASTTVDLLGANAGYFVQPTLEPPYMMNQATKDAPVRVGGTDYMHGLSGFTVPCSFGRCAGGWDKDLQIGADFDLRRSFNRFRARIGVTDSSADGPTVTVKILVDGVEKNDTEYSTRDIKLFADVDVDLNVKSALRVSIIFIQNGLPDNPKAYVIPAIGGPLAA